MSSLRRGRISAALLWALADVTASVIIALKQFAYFSTHKLVYKRRRRIISEQKEGFISTNRGKTQRHELRSASGGVM